MINLYLGDNLEALRKMDDKQYDLAIVDPPYDIHKHGAQTGGKGKLKDGAFCRGKYEHWDISPPQEYFDHLFRVSKNQVIWGANYFTLPSTRCVVCWDKCQPWPNFSQWEMAWTSFPYPAKLFKFDNRTGGKIHPTQKPVALYRWILEHFAKEGDKILDTHLGSGSIAIACHDMKYDLDGWELDPDYFAAAKARLETHQQQQQLFTGIA